MGITQNYIIVAMLLLLYMNSFDKKSLIRSQFDMVCTDFLLLH